MKRPAVIAATLTGWALALVAGTLALAGCGSSATIDATAVPSAATLARVHIPPGDWTRFGYDAQRSGVSPAATGLNRHNVGALRLRRVKLPGTVDSAAIELHGVVVHGRRHDVGLVQLRQGAEPPLLRHRQSVDLEPDATSGRQQVVDDHLRP